MTTNTLRRWQRVRKSMAEEAVGESDDEAEAEAEAESEFAIE